MRLSTRIDESLIRLHCEKTKIPIIDYILNQIKAKKEKITIFAACPNSESVLKAAIRSATRANAPIKYAATLNQVDLDGGYTGWTQEIFIRKIKEESARYGFKGPNLVAVDHGGPWLKDMHSLAGLSLAQTMEAVKDSFVASVAAGYDLLHVDPTVDRTLLKGESISIDTVAARTLELIEHVERFRRSRKLPRISYEVGTEEVHGGLADMKTFRRFLNLLKSGLKSRNLADVWPCFVVGKVGTDLHTTYFNPRVAANLAREAGRFGSVIKGHYTDSVENPQDYPKTGMGGANIGPEFTEAEYSELISLVETEDRLYKQGFIAEGSGFYETLTHAVIESGRWKKWLFKNEKGKEFKALAKDRQGWLVRTGCRYIWAAPSVVSARSRLYKNLERNGIAAEERVLMKIEQAMDKYFRSFNLIDLNGKLESWRKKL